MLGHKTIVYTDHAALKALLNVGNPSGKLARRGIAIQEIEPEIRYRPSRRNANADALSRCPLKPKSDTVALSSREEDHPSHTRQSYLPTDVSLIWEDQSSRTGGTVAEEQRKDPKLCDMIKFLESWELPPDEERARCLALEIKASIWANWWDSTPHWGETSLPH